MMLKQIGFIISVSLLTVISLAGSIALPFFLLDILDNKFGIVGNPHYSELALLIFGLSIIIGSILAGGAFWGWGVGRLTKVATKHLIRAGAIIWTASVFVAGFILYFSQILGPPLQQMTSLDIHTLFTMFFIPAIGLTVASVSYRMTGRMNFDDIRGITARNAGIAAMIGFLIMSVILLHFFQWEVGGPFAGRRYSMITIMNVCNAGAALLGGAAMAWTWSRSSISGNENL